MSSDQVFSVRTILCPTDFSPASSAALSYAMSLTREYDAQLILMHVAAGTVLHSTEEMHRVTDSIKDRLRQLLTLPHDLAFAPQLEVAFGAPAEAISRVAAEFQIDLLVVGVHSMGPIQAHQYERTAYRVIRWSQCPALTVSTSTQKGPGSSG